MSDCVVLTRLSVPFLRISAARTHYDTVSRREGKSFTDHTQISIGVCEIMTWKK
jgi:hypothetical protein